MTVVRVPPVLRNEAGGAKEVVASGATVREVMENLSEQLPALGERVYDAGELRPFVNVYVDGEDVRTRAGLDTPVTTSSTVILLPAMAGGLLASPAGRRSRAAEPPSAATCRP